MEMILWQPEHKTTKLLILAGVIALTLAIHYGLVIEPLFGEVHWGHAIHGRFCYIPIVIAAAWFGLRGGLLAAALISAAVLPYILTAKLGAHELASEYAEIVFYFAVALLAGALFDRELRAREKAENMRLQLERSHKLSLVGQIAAGMAHEIKNPLASVKGAVEILSDESVSPGERDEFRKIVFKEIKRMNNSITDFLEFARPSETTFERIDLSEVATASWKQIQAQAGKRNISVTVSADDKLYINGDEEKIHQVLLNLLLNAIDASEDNSQVIVRLRRETEGEIVLIQIEDNGGGIDEADIARVFEPFFTTRSSGTGLGLAIAKTIVERHGGTISLKNRPEGGVIASIELPLINDEVDA